MSETKIKDVPAPSQYPLSTLVRPLRSWVKQTRCLFSSIITSLTRSIQGNRGWVKGYGRGRESQDLQSGGPGRTESRKVPETGYPSRSTSVLRPSLSMTKDTEGGLLFKENPIATRNRSKWRTVFHRLSCVGRPEDIDGGEERRNPDPDHCRETDRRSDRMKWWARPTDVCEDTSQGNVCLGGV